MPFTSLHNAKAARSLMLDVSTAHAGDGSAVRELAETAISAIEDVIDELSPDEDVRVLDGRGDPG